jgi:hypothetical protein
MLDIIANEELNKKANEYIESLFEWVNEEIENSKNYKEALLNLFPHHLIETEIKKCKKIYHELYSWITDEFLHDDLRPIHQYLLYQLLVQESDLIKDLESDDTSEDDEVEEDEDEEDGDPDDEAYIAKNIENPDFYIDYMFEDTDFLDYKMFYDTFNTDIALIMRYDPRISELLPRDKRKELEAESEDE